MRIIAVDDELLQLETIMEYTAQLYPNASLHGFSKVSEVRAFMEDHTVDLAILDISLPGNLNGIGLGELLRSKNRDVKLLYCTGYADYAMDAFSQHANGYLRKPIRKEELKKELQYILQMPTYGSSQKPYIHTFGNFDVFVGDTPVTFRRSKSKEVLAYLCDREGSWVTNRELVTVLWDEQTDEAALSKYITTLVNDMVSALSQAGIGHIVKRERGKLRLQKMQVDCDYYDYLRGDAAAREHFHMEYMSQYSWGEDTLANLVKEQKNMHQTQK